MRCVFIVGPRIHTVPRLTGSPQFSSPIDSRIRDSREHSNLACRIVEQVEEIDNGRRAGTHKFGDLDVLTAYVCISLFGSFCRGGSSLREVCTVPDLP